MKCNEYDSVYVAIYAKFNADWFKGVRVSVYLFVISYDISHGKSFWPQ